jgi:hypothetical protein
MDRFSRCEFGEEHMAENLGGGLGRLPDETLRCRQREVAATL